MTPKGLPQIPYHVTAKNDFIQRWVQVWRFSKGNWYVTETTSRDGRFEIRIKYEITDDIEKIKPFLTQIEEFLNGEDE